MGMFDKILGKEEEKIKNDREIKEKKLQEMQEYEDELMVE